MLHESQSTWYVRVYCVGSSNTKQKDFTSESTLHQYIKSNIYTSNIWKRFVQYNDVNNFEFHLSIKPMNFRILLIFAINGNHGDHECSKFQTDVINMIGAVTS